MANSNTTLASLWMDDGQGSPSKFAPETPTKVVMGSELQDDIVRFYKDSGLEPYNKEQVGFLDANGDLVGYSSKDQIIASKAPVQIIAVPMVSPVKMSPYKESFISKSQVIIPQNQVVNQSSPRTIMPVDSRWSGKKRTVQQSEITLEADFTDSKRGKRGEKGGKGLRHFSMKVCEKVQKKGVTSYNEVADELVAEFTDPRNMAATSEQGYDQKNIRRRVYDALNVLMAMNIISKEKKEIRWIGLPTNSAQECQNLETEKQNREARIKQKTQQLQDLIIQQIAFKNLVQRNKDLQKVYGSPASNSAIHLPFIIVNTSKKTVIDCSISNDKYEYLFNFDNTFEIHDDIEVLKRMGMALGLEKGDCNQECLEKAVKMVPKSFQNYVIEMATSKSIAGPSCSGIAGMAGVGTPQSRYKPITPLSPLSVPSIQQASSDVTDMEVAMATGHGLSRQSSYSDMHSRTATETPSDNFSDDSDSDRSSPIDIS